MSKESLGIREFEAEILYNMSYYSAVEDFTRSNSEFWNSCITLVWEDYIINKFSIAHYSNMVNIFIFNIINTL